MSQDAEGQKVLNGDSPLLRDEAEVNYPKGAQLAIIVILLAFCVLLVALDNTIIATVIPSITDHFNALGDVAWYVSAYLFTSCTSQLLFGKIYSHFPLKWVFLSSLVMFEIGSAVCGAAPTSRAFIVGRAIAGIGCAGTFNGGLVVIAHSVPLIKRPMYTSIVASVYGIASVFGPILGGALTDRASWRWCFYMNLPLGAVVIVVAFFTIKDYAPTRKYATGRSWLENVMRFDPLGTLAFVPGVICLLLALQWGGSTYPWSDPRIIGLFVMAGLLIIAFILFEIRAGDDAIVSIQIVTQRNVACAMWFTFCIAGAFYVLVIYLPIWFQAIKGVSAVKSGIMSLPLLLSVVAMSIISGAVVTKTGYYVPVMIASTVILPVGAGLLTTLTPRSGHAEWIGYQFLVGVGTAFGLQQGLVVVQTVLERKDISTGTAMIVFTENFAGALMVALGNTLFENRLIDELRRIRGIDPQIVLTAGARNLRGAVKPAFVDAVQHGYNNALTQSWYLAVGLACLSIFGSAFLEWRDVKEKKESTGERVGDDHVASADEAELEEWEKAFDRASFCSKKESQV